MVWDGGFPATSTTGVDNIPGATRGGVFAGGAFNETLTMYLARPDALEFTLHGIGGTFAHVRLDGYAETARFESICSGRATYIVVVTYVCSPDQAAAYDFWYTSHMDVFEALATRIGTTVLAGDCPCACGFSFVCTH
ncbi:hypothetical protein C8R43DRAFT_1050737, partial [Mycena crocata]